MYWTELHQNERSSTNPLASDQKMVKLALIPSVFVSRRSTASSCPFTLNKNFVEHFEIHRLM